MMLVASGAVKSATGVGCTVIMFVFVSVDVHPSEVVTVKLTEYCPAVA
jgi:hypothetical protein